MKAVNSHLRKVVNMDLHHLAPQAIRCSLKDLVPYDLVRVQDEVLIVGGRRCVYHLPVCSDAGVEQRGTG